VDVTKKGERVEADKYWDKFQKDYGFFPPLMLNYRIVQEERLMSDDFDNEKPEELEN